MDDMDLEKAGIQAIRVYLNRDFTDEEIKQKFGYALLMIKNNIQNSMKVDSNVVSKTQGSRSVTYRQGDNIITDSIKAMLPRPYIKCL